MSKITCSKRGCFHNTYDEAVDCHERRMTEENTKILREDLSGKCNKCDFDKPYCKCEINND